MGHSKLQTTDRYIANVGENHKEAINFTSKKFSNMLNNAIQADAKAMQDVPPNVPPKENAKNALDEKVS